MPRFFLPRLSPPDMHISPSIFKAYDVRGIVPSTLNADVARALGRAFGMAARQAQQTTVSVGRDGRFSWLMLS